MKLELISKTSTVKRKGVLLLVHGVCHGAWVWENYLTYFSTNGYDTYALSLRGHGKSEGRAFLNHWGLSDYVCDVIKTILSLDEKPILIGHSMGGAIAQKVIGEHPDLLKAVVLLAPSLVGGLSLSWKIRTIKNNPVKSLQFQSLLKGKNINEKTVMQSLFIDNRVETAIVRKITPLIQAESTRAQADLDKAYTPYYSNIKIPILVIGSKDDIIFTAEDLIRIAAAYGIEPVILSDMCHDMMIDKEWRKSAVEILKFLDETETKK